MTSKLPEGFVLDPEAEFEEIPMPPKNLDQRPLDNILDNPGIIAAMIETDLKIATRGQLGTILSGNK